MKRSVEERFWEKVDRTGDCWLWTGCKIKDGYGRFGIRSYELELAHRVAWELTYGPIPEGKEVCHTCDNPPCVNPAHLFLADHKMNMRDMVVKARQSKGEHRPNHKLTYTQVQEIIKSPLSYRKLAVVYSVGKTTIEAAKTGRSWRFKKNAN